jgi:hypothetical protein
LTDSEQDSEQPVDDNLLTLGKVHKEDEGHDPFDDDFETSAIGNLLPDDEDELLAGIMDDFDLSGLPNQLEDLDENDLFVNGGGFEMDFEPQESLSFGISKMSISDGIASNGIGPYAIPNGVTTVAGEHPYGEHPSRTLFVRNFNSNVEDSELRTLFEVLYTYLILQYIVYLSLDTIFNVFGEHAFVFFCFQIEVCELRPLIEALYK